MGFLPLLHLFVISDRGGTMLLARTRAIFVALSALTALVFSSQPASAETTTTVCSNDVCITVWRTGNYVRQATVYLQHLSSGSAWDFHYYGPSGTPNRWARSIVCGGSCAFRFERINWTYVSGRLVCGEMWQVGHLQGRPCVTI
jgi:hypothetical protein